VPSADRTTTVDTNSNPTSVTTAPRDDDAPHVDQENLGFGRVVAQEVRGRFLARDGSPNSRKYGLGPQRLERIYLGALNATWLAFLSWSLGGIMLLNGCFTLAYIALGQAAIAGQAQAGMTDPFLSAFSFSLAVFTTSDTTPMFAVGATAHWLVIFESLLGPLTVVLVAGLLIARLIRPHMQLRYSESAVVAPYENGRALMFRIVNTQRSELSDVQVRVNLAMFETHNGVRNREFYQLELELDSVQFFSLHWTLVHPITASSPLRGFTPAMLREAEAEMFVSVNAHEATFSTRVISRSSYLWDEIRWDAKFANIFVSAPDGVIAIDVERLDRLETLPEGATSTPSALEQVSADAGVGVVGHL
jgi:inward rectifier potassium channel